MPERFGSSSFVGREPELSQLLTTWEDASSGHGRLVMLVGEPGIGKTRLAEEFHRAVCARGGMAFWGRCHEEPAAPPYWPWVQVLRSYFTHVGSEQLFEEMGTQADPIAQVVPGLRDRLPDIEPAIPGDPEQAQFRLFDAVTTLLKTASKQQPLAIILDNLHWADPSSLRLLEFLAQELSDSHLLVLGTYRDVEVSWGGSLFHTLGDLSRQRLFHRIPLRGLALDEVRELIRRTAGLEPADGLVSMVHGQTEGNPFFVGEVVRLLAQEGMLGIEGLDDLERWDFRLPEGVREVIGRRLAGLSDECMGLLTQASVVGREFSLPLIASLSGSTEDRALEMMEEALRRGLIKEVPREVDRFQFTHALIQQTLVSEISIARRVRLHARIADGLETLYSDETGEHASELARHFLEAGTFVDVDKAIQYALLAAYQALEAYAYEEAEKWFQRGLAARGGGDLDETTADLLLGLGSAQVVLAKNKEAQQNLERCHAYWVTTQNAKRAVDAFELMVPDRNEIEAFVAISEQTLSLVAPASREAGHALSKYGLFKGYMSGDYAGAQRAFSEALEIARKEDDLSLESGTLARAAGAAWFRLRYDDCFKRATEQIRLSAETGLNSHVPAANHYAAFVCMSDGRLGMAKDYATNALSVAKQLRHRVHITFGLWLRESFDVLEGNWAAARRSSEDALDKYPDYVPLLCNRALVEYATGNNEAGKSHLNRMIEGLRLSEVRLPSGIEVPVFSIPYMAALSGDTDHLDMVADWARTTVGSFAVGEPARMFAWQALALISAARQDAQAATQCYDHLVSLRGRFTWPVTVDRMLGLLANMLGRLEIAVDHFEDSLAFCRERGYRPEFVWTCYAYAKTLLSRRAPGDLRRALDLVTEGLLMANELAMAPLVNLLALLKEQSVGARMGWPVYPNGLTHREVEVLRLIAAGKTNQQIANTLVITVHTVERHVSNIFDKTGAANRAEATAFAVRHGLV